MDDVGRIDHVPLLFAYNGVGHGGTYLDPNGGDYAAAVVDWLDWRLKGDEHAARTFVGDACGLCKKGRLDGAATAQPNSYWQLAAVSESIQAPISCTPAVSTTLLASGGIAFASRDATCARAAPSARRLPAR